MPKRTPRQKLESEIEKRLDEINEEEDNNIEQWINDNVKIDGNEYDDYDEDVDIDNDGNDNDIEEDGNDNDENDVNNEEEDNDDTTEIKPTNVQKVVPEAEDNKIICDSSDKPKVEVSVTDKSEKIDPKTLKQKTKETINQIFETAESLEKSNEFVRDYDEYLEHDSELYTLYRKFMLQPTNIPDHINTKQHSLQDYITTLTNFPYNPYDSTNTALLHSHPEQVIYLTRLGKLFNYDFIPKDRTDFRFYDIADKISAYLTKKARDVPTTIFEYRILVIMLTRLQINLCTDIELALRDNEKPTMTAAFKKALMHDIETMKHIQRHDMKTMISWNEFLIHFLDTDTSKMIYRFRDNGTLRRQIIECYKDVETGQVGAIEGLLGNTLKCYIPSVSTSYFYVIKAIYLMCRLLSVYIVNKLYANKSEKQIIDDLITLATSAELTYEAFNHTMKRTNRVLPKYKYPISQNMQMYILDHATVGGPFMLLKMMEKSLPVLAEDIKNIAD